MRRKVGHDWISNLFHRQFDSVSFSIARTGLTVLPRSPWPIFVSLGVLGVVSRFICAIHGGMTFMSLLIAEAS